MARAIEYRIGYMGSFPDDNYVQSWWMCTNQHTASEMEHAVVMLVTRFRGEADQALRKSLGTHYDQWETSEDQKEVPEDVIF